MAVVGLGVAAVEGPRTLAKRLRDDVMGKPEAVIPNAPEGQIHLDTVHSKDGGTKMQSGACRICREQGSAR